MTKSHALEIILIEIELQELPDHVVSAKVFKCWENETENRSASVFVNFDQVDFYTYP